MFDECTDIATLCLPGATTLTKVHHINTCGYQRLLMFHNAPITLTVLLNCARTCLYHASLAHSHTGCLLAITFISVILAFRLPHLVSIPSPVRTDFPVSIDTSHAPLHTCCIVSGSLTALAPHRLILNHIDTSQCSTAIVDGTWQCGMWCVG